jgi:hypothetical protein
MGDVVRNSSGRRRRHDNIVKVAVGMIAGTGAGRVGHAAAALRVSEPTLYRWIRDGNFRRARGRDILRVHEMTGLPMEMLLKG